MEVDLILRTKDHRGTELTSENTQKTVAYVQNLMPEFEDVLDGSQSGWLFGFGQPSAMDAHLAVFIARMNDMEYGDLIPEALQKYAKRIFETEEWINLMQGKTTNPFDAYSRGHRFENCFENNE